jgi:hypothetical protein
MLDPSEPPRKPSGTILAALAADRPLCRGAQKGNVRDSRDTIRTRNTAHEGGGVLKKPTVLEAYQQGKLSLPPGYDLDFDPDMILLRKGDTTVAAFGVADTTPLEVTKVAWEHHTEGRNNSA